jgi:hypothetical protein
MERQPEGISSSWPTKACRLVLPSVRQSRLWEDAEATADTPKQPSTAGKPRLRRRVAHALRRRGAWWSRLRPRLRRGFISAFPTTERPEMRSVIPSARPLAASDVKKPPPASATRSRPSVSVRSDTARDAYQVGGELIQIAIASLLPIFLIL